MATIGITDLATSIYPEIESNGLVKAAFPRNQPQVQGFRAPIAPMFSPQQVPKLNTNIMFSSNMLYTGFANTTLNDNFGDRLALDPEDRSQMAAGTHYSNKHALLSIEETDYGHVEERQKTNRGIIPKKACHGYAEELALLPVRKGCQKPLCRNRKKAKARTIEESHQEYAEEFALSPTCTWYRKIDRYGGGKLPKRNIKGTFDFAIREIAASWRQRTSTSQEMTSQVDAEKHEDFLTQKPARRLKRNHLVADEQKLVRKSKRPRKAVNYKE